MLWMRIPARLAAMARSAIGRDSQSQPGRTAPHDEVADHLGALATADIVKLPVLGCLIGCRDVRTSLGPVADPEQHLPAHDEARRLGRFDDERRPPALVAIALARK